MDHCVINIETPWASEEEIKNKSQLRIRRIKIPGARSTNLDKGMSRRASRSGTRNSSEEPETKASSGSSSSSRRNKAMKAGKEEFSGNNGEVFSIKVGTSSTPGANNVNKCGHHHCCAMVGAAMASLVFSTLALVISMLALLSTINRKRPP